MHGERTTRAPHVEKARTPPEIKARKMENREWWSVTHQASGAPVVLRSS